jgi:putative transposase
MKKKKKKISQEELGESCLKYQKKIFLPKENENYNNFFSNSWFSIRKTNNLKKILKEKKNNKEKEIYYSKKFILFPTKEQKDILNLWYLSTTFLYNETLKIIKSNKYYKKPEELTLNNLRSQLLEKKKNFNVPSHILDCSISKAISNYKSAITNFKRKNTSNYRIRYYRFNRNKQNIFIEPCYVLKNGNITVLGLLKILDIETKEKYDIQKENLKSTFSIQYDKKLEKYYVFIPFKRITQTPENREKIISLDPGISPFLVGVTEKNSCFIGENCYEKIKNKIKTLDKINNSKNIDNKRKYKIVKRIREKIQNLVDDLHWKSIKYLTTNYKNILIGDFSVKEYVEQDSKSKISKRISHSLRLYAFKMRLEFKCKERNCNMSIINEYMTSKTCSCCGNYKKDLGMCKEYNCEKCKKKIHRDINGARCIFFRNCIN